MTTPYIPGLELHIPPGTVVRNEEGDVVTTVGITPIPVDRPPFPLAQRRRRCTSPSSRAARTSINRISEARDNTNRTVTYTYDANGNLS